MELSVRPLEPADADAALALVHTYDVAHFGEPLFELQDLLAAWRSPPFALADDSEGFEDADGELVAVSWLDARGGIEVAVAPAWSEAALDEVLTARWEDEARRRGFGSVHRYLAAADADGREALVTRGWSHDYTSWILRLEADAHIAVRTLPPGYAVRPLTEADAQAAYAVVTEAFGEWEHRPPRSYAAWRAELVDRPDVTLEHCWGVVHTDELVGVSLVIDAAADGAPELWVAQLAVRPAHRHRGLAQRLLAESFGAARTRGCPLGGLSTSDRTGALGLYTRLGMTVRQTLHCLTLRLDD